MKPANLPAWSTSDLHQALDGMPYARYLGLQLHQDELGLYCRLPCKAELIGNPLLPAYHGGVVATLLEMAAWFYLRLDARCQGRNIQMVSFDTDYLRPAFGVESCARAYPVRIGKAVANVRAEVWQSNPGKPVAVGKGNYLLLRDA